MAGVRRARAALICVVLLLVVGCSGEDPDPDRPDASVLPTAVPTGTRPASEVPSRATDVGADPVALRAEAALNEKSQYRLRPGQKVNLALGLRNSRSQPVDTTIVIEVLCEKAQYNGTDKFTVPGSSSSGTDVVATWRGTATIPADCESLGIPGVADGSLNAEVRTAGSERGLSSTVTFTVGE